MIGDAVNVTWRLQERTKDHPGEILIGRTLSRLIEAEFDTEELGSLIVGGSLEVDYMRLVTGALSSVCDDPPALLAAGRAG